MTNQPISRKPFFNVSLVVQETGIKPDTLRAWERRYELPVPSRTEGGHRLYSQYDIETLKWLLARQQEGMRISQAVDYWRELIAAGIDPLHESPPEPSEASAPTATARDIQSLDNLRQQWLEYSLAFNEERARGALTTAFRHYPWEVVFSDLIYQGLREIGDGWYKGNINVQQEHFASELVINELQSLIADAPAPYHPQKILISNPPGEFHTIAPLTFNLLLRYRGWEVTYLGANVPLDHLEEALTTIKPSLVLMTAARLSTAAELLKAGRLLYGFNVPLAYSGSVFTEIPELADRIPGTYLGQDLGQAVSQVESLIVKPDQQELKPPEPSPYQRLIESFKSKLSYLENAALLNIQEGMEGDFPEDLIRDAYEYLLKDILAALELGEINYLQTNIAWVDGLLESRQFEAGYLIKYLESFIDVSRKALGSDANEILTWLADFLEEIVPQESKE